MEKVPVLAGLLLGSHCMETPFLLPPWGHRHPRPWGARRRPWASSPQGLCPGPGSSGREDPGSGAQRRAQGPHLRQGSSLQAGQEMRKPEVGRWLCKAGDLAPARSGWNRSTGVRRRDKLLGQDGLTYLRCKWKARRGLFSSEYERRIGTRDTFVQPGGACVVLCQLPCHRYKCPSSKSDVLVQPRCARAVLVQSAWPDLCH